MAQAAEDTGVCWWIWWKEPWHQSEHHRMAGMGPLGQEMGEWLQLLALNRGKRTPSQHRERSSTSTPVLLYGGHEGGWGHPWGTQPPSPCPLWRGRGTEDGCWCQAHCPAILPQTLSLLGTYSKHPRGECPASALGTALAQTQELDAEMQAAALLGALALSRAIAA